MKKEHHTQTKEKRTMELLDRVLNLLVTSEVPISLNNVTYNDITMSAPQIINAMHEYAEPSERIDGIIIKDKSSFSKSKNTTYYNMKEDAKDARTSFLLEGKSTQFHNNPSLLDLKLAVESLTVENDKLRTQLARKDNIIKLNEFNESLSETNKTVSFLPNHIKADKLNNILTKLLTLLSDVGMISISKVKNGKAGEINYRFMGKTHKVCNITELEDLMETYIENNNNIDVIKIKQKVSK